MDIVRIAQAVWDKTRAVTVPSRLDELVVAFERSGIRLDPARTTVLSVAEAGSFTRLGDALKTDMPTAAITAKRVLADNGITS